MDFRGVINGKAGKAAALPKYLDTLTLSQPRGADYAQPLALPHLKTFVITPLPLAFLISWNCIQHFSIPIQIRG